MHQALNGGIHHPAELAVDHPQQCRITQLTDFIGGFHAPTLARGVRDAPLPGR